MSNTRAIAAVTATLKALLDKVTDPIGIDEPDPDLVINVDVTTKPPEKARPAETNNQLNLFLYQISPNAAFRNMDIFSSGGTPQVQLPLALNLHYLVTAYGAGAEDLIAHRLLGRAVALFHQHAVLSSLDIKNALTGNDLYQQVERVRITPQSLGNEEMSKLWTTLQTGYRISVAYEVSVVLIDNPVPATAAPPVLARGRSNQGVEVHPSLVPRTPTLLGLELPNQKPSAHLGQAPLAGDLLVYSGLNLEGSSVVVDFEHLTQAARNTRTPATVTASEVQVELPDDQVNWPAGIYRTLVRVTRVGDPNRPSNALFVAVAPRLTALTPGARLPNGDLPLQVEVSPQLWPDQRTVLVFGDQEVLLPSRTSRQSILDFVVKDPPAGVHLVRLRVDGVESLVIQDYSASPPVYDPSQQVTVT